MSKDVAACRIHKGGACAWLVRGGVVAVASRDLFRWAAAGGGCRWEAHQLGCSACNPPSAWTCGRGRAYRLSPRCVGGRRGGIRPDEAKPAVTFKSQVPAETEDGPQWSARPVAGQAAHVGRR